jgi:outer membrane protein OmpA-like peptidoglycan-associated protein
MSFNLIETVKTTFTVETTNKIAGNLGESSAHVHQALMASIPTVLTGVLLKADSADTQDTLNAATDAARQETSSVLESFTAPAGHTKGVGFLNYLFAEKTQAVSDAVAGYTGVSNQSALTLMAIVAPSTLAVLGKHILDSNMNASGLRSFLAGQKKKILYAMPAGIFLEGVLGLDGLSGISEKFYGQTMEIEKPKKKQAWILPVVLIGILGAGAAWYFLRDNPKPVSDPQPVAKVAVPIHTDSLTVVKVPASTSPLKLPDGNFINAKKGGLEDQLISFLDDSHNRPSRRFQFTFDQLNFNPGSAALTNESLVQIQNIVAILKAFPRTRIKIGGFTDRGGDSLTNTTLVEKRAASVSEALKAAGAGPGQVVGSEGFGTDFARYPADAPDSLREKDRRISISIRSR